MNAREYVLPDFLKPGIDVVIVGTMAGDESKKVGHYYADSRNELWELLEHAGLTSRLLQPIEDGEILDHGVGFTDLDKYRWSSSDEDAIFDIDDFLARLSGKEPRWIAFNGVKPAMAYRARFGLVTAVPWGRQGWSIGPCGVFVAPASSSRYPQGKALRGGKTRKQHWEDLGALVRAKGKATG